MSALPTRATLAGTPSKAAAQALFLEWYDFNAEKLGSDAGAAPVTVASAATVDLDAVTTVRDIVISGTTTITGFTVGRGKKFHVRASGAFTLTNNAAIVTHTGANIVCAAGDSFFVRATATDTVEVLDHVPLLLSKTRGGTGSATSRTLAQTVNTQTGAVATGSTVIPYDDTIPQNTEGDQYMSLAITPTNASSTLEIDVVIHVSSGSAVGQNIVALFQDSTANALAAVVNQQFASGQPATIAFKHTMTAGTTSATTFKVRAGPVSAATMTFNGASGARNMGGVMASSITIKEYLP